MTSSGMDERRFQWQEEERQALNSVESSNLREYTLDGIPEDVRPQSRFDRPKSRRGMKDFSRVPSSNSSGSDQYAGSSKRGIGSARPPTGPVMMNRTPSAISRLGVATSAGLSRLNTGLVPPGTALGINMIDRPITQHGIAGLRPETTRGLPMTRQIQDKRYYVGLLQLKIRELTQEIGAILKDIDNQNKEKAKLLHSDKRAKDLAAELTALQGELADYNIIVDKMTSDVDKETIELEARELAMKNESTSLEVEELLEERKKVEKILNEAKNQLEMQKRRTETLVNSMDENMRETYESLTKQKVELQDRANEMQRQLDELTKEQLRFEEEIAMSPLKQEAVKLHLKIIEAEGKRDKLKEEEGNKLPPEVERQRLMQKIKQDNVEIAAAEAQFAETKRRIAELEQQLEQFELEAEDAQSEKQIKYNELRKREEVIEQFMSSFDQNKEEEIKKRQQLEETIVEHLAAISNVLGVDVGLVTNEEMAILHSLSSFENYERTEHDQSYDGLSKEHIKLQRILNKIEMLEGKLKNESVELKQKIDNLDKEVQFLQSSKISTAQSEVKREELESEMEQLKQQKSSCEEDLKVIRNTHKDLKQKLEKNTVYTQISSLETKLEALVEESKNLEQFVRDQTKRANNDSLKERVHNLVADYGTELKRLLQVAY